MLPTTFFLILLLLIGASCILRPYLRRKRTGMKLPPGPRGLPIIGSLHMLGNLPHQSLQKMAKKYGPIMYMRLGQVPTIVVSSPQAAELFLKTNGTVFASRPKVQASEYMSYGAKAMAFTEYGPYWRFIRKLCTLELFTATKIESFRPMRREYLREVIESLKKSALEREVVNVSAKVGELIENMSFGMVLGRCRDDRFDLKGVVQEALRLAGAFNISDYVPWLAPFDLQGLTRRMKEVSKEIDEIFETIINEREHKHNTLEKETQYNKDFTDLLLALINRSTDSYMEESFKIDKSNVKAIMLDIFAASNDSSATTIQWTFLELLKNPRIMKKLQAELDNVAGLSKVIQETDVKNLAYLDMVIKESLRLHPVAPFLIPHESMEDIVIDGYYIPKKSRIFINSWAIGRDREAWSDNAEEFYPERFEGSDIDLRGHHFQLIPFGSGKRGCPGMQLGLTTVRIGLAQLLHCFDWELPHGMSRDELSMTEKFGLALPPENDVLAVPTYRLRD